MRTVGSNSSGLVPELRAVSVKWPASETEVVWEQHCCLPLHAGADVGQLARYLDAGASFVSVNVGYAPQGLRDAVSVLSTFRAYLLAHPDTFVLATGIADVVLAKKTGRLAVAFDLEDANPLEGRLDLLQVFYDLGVRTLLPTYNTKNLAGHGCLDDSGEGLTAWGRDLVGEMNRVGMVVDASHANIRTSMDLFEVSCAPVIFSHSSMLALWDHPRNITDDQVRACAATGGVVGINGVGIFLGENDIRTETIVNHIDHAVSLVGPEHVGIGLDYVFDIDDLEEEGNVNPELFQPSDLQVFADGFAPPEHLPEIASELTVRGYTDVEVAAILGGNFLRVASEVWKAPANAA